MRQTNQILQSSACLLQPPCSTQQHHGGVHASWEAGAIQSSKILPQVSSKVKSKPTDVTSGHRKRHPVGARASPEHGPEHGPGAREAPARGAGERPSLRSAESARARVSGRAGGQIQSGRAREGRYLVQAVEGDLVAAARPDRRRRGRRRLRDHDVGALAVVGGGRRGRSAAGGGGVQSGGHRAGLSWGGGRDLRWGRRVWWENLATEGEDFSGEVEAMMRWGQARRARVWCGLCRDPGKKQNTRTNSEFFLLINRKKEGKEKGGTETTIMVRGKDGF